MSVVPSQVIIYGSANMPEDLANALTTGGALDLTKRVMFSDLPYQGLTGSANTDTLDVVSGTSGDTGVHVQVTGRDSTGAIQTPAFVTCTGTTLISASFGGQRFQRLQAGVITGGSINTLTNPAGTAAVSDVAVISHTRILSGRTVGSVGSTNTSGVTPPLFRLATGDGATLSGLVYQGLGVIIRIIAGTGVNQLRMISAPYAAGTAGYGTDLVAVNRDWTTIPDATTVYDLAYGFLFDILPNPVTAITRMFAQTSADVPGGAQKVYYDKVFVVNTNGTTSLLSATVQIFSESGTLPSGATLDLATGTGANDTVSIASRLNTAPTGTAGFVVQPSAINFPSSIGGNLATGSVGSLALWARLTLNAGTATYQGAADFRITGNTT